LTYVLTYSVIFFTSAASLISATLALIAADVVSNVSLTQPLTF